MYDRPAGKGKPNPYNKRNAKDTKKAVKKTIADVKPVAKDTNKTRRKMVRPTRGKQDAC